VTTDNGVGRILTSDHDERFALVLPTRTWWIASYWDTRHFVSSLNMTHRTV
jgi:hypothetical protein